MEITVLSGGTGTPKLLDGFRQLPSVNNEKLSIVANNADDVEISGNLVCPDLDTVIYTMADMIDRDTWFGIDGDSFHAHEGIHSLSRSKPRGSYLPTDKQTAGHDLSRWRRFSGYHEFMKIGDRDRATHITRTGLVEEGANLTRATELMTDALGIDATILPMSNDPVATIIHTPGEAMHFQEFWLGRGGDPDVEAIELRGIEDARPTGAVRQSLENPVVIGPSNPITSIGPILSLPGVREKLRQTTVIAISPFVNDRVFSGPAGEFMEVRGYEPSTRGMLDFYDPLLDFVILDQDDQTESDLTTIRTNTDFSDPGCAQVLAERVVELLNEQ